MRSEVFENYIEIMSQKGFIKKEAEAMTRVEKENSSEYRDTIQALYGLDIKLNDSDKGIVEQAHPEKIVIAPSYDRVNGLVENIQERHDIITGIVMKPTNGNLTQHRYAQKELLDELIRLGFALDNAGEEELSKLADECSIKLTAEMRSSEDIMKKEAMWGAIIPWIPRIVKWTIGLGALAAAKNKLFGVLSQGVKPDTDRAIDNLSKLSVAVGPKDKTTLNHIIRMLELFKAKTAKMEPILARTENQQIESLEDPKDIVGIRYKVHGTQEEIQKMNKYIRICSALATFLNSKEDEIRGMETQRSARENEWLHAVRWIYEEVSGDAADDAANATDALEDSLAAFVDKHASEMAKGAGEVKEKSESILGELQGTLGLGDDKGKHSQSPLNIPAVLQGLFR